MILTDQIGHIVELGSIPQRIVSLVPSQTELLFDLGLEPSIVGATKFCIHPAEKLQHVQKIGGTKDFSIDKIKALKPDLIIANKEENEEVRIKELQALYPVYTSDIFNLNHAYAMMQDIGMLCGVQEQSKLLIESIQNEFDKIEVPITTKKVLYFIWQNPYMVAGRNTFIDTLFKYMGLKNALESERYPALTMEEMIATNPDIVFLSSEPYPFKNKHIEEIKIYLPNAKISIVDGELFSWYGSRLLKTPKYFKEIIVNI